MLFRFYRNNETFLIVRKDGAEFVEEIVTIDSEAKSLIVIDFNTGLTIQSFSLGTFPSAV